VTDSPYTESTRDIAENIASEIIEACAVDFLALSYLIEREIDKYIDEGTLKFFKTVDQR
jgi:hypothetical protein